MDARMKHYWRLKATFQEIFGLTDEEEKDHPEVSSLISLCANLALSFKEKGVANVIPSVRDKLLEDMGVSVLKRRSK